VNARVTLLAAIAAASASSLSYAQEAKPPTTPPAPAAAPAPGETAASAAAAPAPAGPTTKELSDLIITQQAGLKEQDARLRAIEKQLEANRAALEEQKKATEAAVQIAAKPPEIPDWLKRLETLKIGGFVQAELQNHQDSDDQLRSGGAPLNQNRFLVRRARLSAGREWEHASLFLELDGNTTKGPAFGLQRAEAAVQYRASPMPAPAVVKLTAGLFNVPFGYEIVESSRTRLFMERTQASRAFYPSEPDVGAKISGEVAWLRYDIAFLNGEPLGSQSGFAGQDPNNHKDLLVHAGVVTEPAERFRLSGGVSAMNGKGFVKGSDGTKGTLTWSDRNQDRRVTSDEIVSVSGTDAAPSYNFDRWLFGADLALALNVAPLGTTKLYGEVVLGSNMDRALYVANPTLSGNASREVGFYVAVIQEVTSYAAVGFRYDFYDPNADFLGYKSGKLVPDPQTVKTYSPMLALVLPGQARLVFQYDVVRDHLGRTDQGLPADLANNAWTLRLQGEL
jgi:hypothetical protein